MPPIFEYRCPIGHWIEDFQTLENRADVIECECGLEAPRQISLPVIHTVETHFGARNTSCGEHVATDLEDPKTGKAPVISSLAEHERVMKERGVEEKPPSANALRAMKRRHTVSGRGA